MSGATIVASVLATPIYCNENTASSKFCSNYLICINGEFTHLKKGMI